MRCLGVMTPFTITILLVFFPVSPSMKCLAKARIFCSSSPPQLKHGIYNLILGSLERGPSTAMHERILSRTDSEKVRLVR